jgi:hypothetical protein
MRPLLPKVIHDAVAGSFDLILLSGSEDVLRQDIRSWGMYLSVLCREEIPFSSRTAFRAELRKFPELAGFFEGFEVGGLAYDACSIWPVEDAEATANRAVVSDLPTLILAGEYDPIAPPTWASKAADTLENAYFYEFPGLGHGVSGNACPMGMMVSFWNDPTAAPDDACLEKMGQSPFVVPMSAVGIPMISYSNEAMAIEGVVPEGWSEDGPGVFSRDPLTRLIQQAAAGASVTKVQELLAGQLGIEALPESWGTRETETLAWELTRVDIDAAGVGQIVVDVALAESGPATYVVILQTTADDHDQLYRAVFVPVVDALRSTAP